MPRFERVAKRQGMREKLKQLQRMLKIAGLRIEAKEAAEFKHGFELGGLAMKKAIDQAQAETREKA